MSRAVSGDATHSRGGFRSFFSRSKSSKATADTSSSPSSEMKQSTSSRTGKQSSSSSPLALASASGGSVGMALGSTAVLDFESGWHLIESRGIQRLVAIMDKGMRGRLTNEEFVMVYTTVYNLCLTKYPQSYEAPLYERYCATLKDFLTHRCKPAIFASERHGAYMLSELVTQYRHYKFLVRWLSEAFSYLDRAYVRRKHKPLLRQIATTLFREIIFSGVKSECVPVALSLVEKDRAAMRRLSQKQKSGGALSLADSSSSGSGSAVDRSILRDFVTMFVDVGSREHKVYVRDFERKYLDETTNYYKVCQQQWAEHLSCGEYLATCERAIIEEQKREVDFLHRCTHEKLLRRLYAVLLINPQSEVLCKEGSGVYSMVAGQRGADLRRLYRLYSFVPKSLQFVATIVRRRLKDEANSFLDSFDVLPKSKQKTGFLHWMDFTPKLVELYERHCALIHDCFEDYSELGKALKEAYCHTVNKALRHCSLSISELLADYCDRLLRKDSAIDSSHALKYGSEDEVLHALDSVVRMFAYASDKDVFLEYYRLLLAKRLLADKCKSDYCEKMFVSQLKIRSGAQFTSKLEGMIRDMQHSRGRHATQFQAFIANSLAKAKADISPLPFELNVNVLTSAFWPQSSVSPSAMKLPRLGRSMQRALHTFEAYFSSVHERRNVKWVHSMGTVLLKANYLTFKGSDGVMLQLSTLQACALLVLNQIDSIRIALLISMLGCDALQLKLSLKPMCSKKYRVLLKSPSEGYSVEHSLSVNSAWKPARKLVRMPQGIAGGVRTVSKKEREETTAVVIEGRKDQIQACVVRIMKARKTLAHGALVDEVTNQLMKRFLAQPKQIKKHIADLIEREYLKRDETDSRVYHYVA